MLDIISATAGEIVGIAIWLFIIWSVHKYVRKWIKKRKTIRENKEVN